MFHNSSMRYSVLFTRNKKTILKLSEKETLDFLILFSSFHYNSLLKLNILIICYSIIRRSVEIEKVSDTIIKRRLKLYRRPIRMNEKILPKKIFNYITR